RRGFWGGGGRGGEGGGGGWICPGRGAGGVTGCERTNPLRRPPPSSGKKQNRVAKKRGGEGQKEGRRWGGGGEGGRLGGRNCQASRLARGYGTRHPREKPGRKVFSHRVIPNRCLDLGQAAIDEQLDAGDVAAVVTGEEHCGFRHLVRRAHPAHRHGGHDVRLELVELLPRPPGDVDPRRFNRAGANGVHADLVVPQVHGPTACERPHSGLAGTVNTGKSTPFGRGERGGQNDRSAAREERQRLLHGEEHSFDVAVE